MKKLTLIAAATLASAGIGAGATIAVAGDMQPEAVEEKFELIGEAENCVNRSLIRSTDVVDDYTIDFTMAGGKVYRNTLPRRCPGLGFEDAFSYRTSINRLCNVDIIRVIRNFGGGINEGAACGLGKFQQIREIEDVDNAG